jgi:hypothetical protein
MIRPMGDRPDPVIGLVVNLSTGTAFALTKGCNGGFAGNFIYVINHGQRVLRRGKILADP